jgi:hypothetical protein
MSRAVQGDPSMAEKLRRQIEDGKGQAKQKLAEGKEKAASAVAEVSEKVTAKAPEPVQKALEQVQQRTSERPVPAAFLAGVLTGWLIGRKRGSKVVLIGGR